MTQDPSVKNSVPISLACVPTNILADAKIYKHWPKKALDNAEKKRDVGNHALQRESEQLIPSNNYKKKAHC